MRGEDGRIAASGDPEMPAQHPLLHIFAAMLTPAVLVCPRLSSLGRFCSPGCPGGHPGNQGEPPLGRSDHVASKR
jgi:hypothetical protein